MAARAHPLRSGRRHVRRAGAPLARAARRSEPRSTVAIARGWPQDATVDNGVESGPGPNGQRVPALTVRLLGPLTVHRQARPVALPRSRKVRALLAFLCLEASSSSRSRLCGLLWDVPNDPRGELRWCLSKLRGILDEPDRRRVLTPDPESIALDLSDCRVDVFELKQGLRAGLEHVPSERLEALCELFGGELLEGLRVDGTPEFSGWLSGQRYRYRMQHTHLLAELVARAPRGSDAAFRHLEAWLRVAPFDQKAHELMLEALLKCGRVQDAEEHVATSLRSFQQEGLDWGALRDAWQALRSSPPPAAPARESSAGVASAAPSPERARPEAARSEAAPPEPARSEAAPPEPARSEAAPPEPARSELPLGGEPRPRRRKSIAVMPFSEGGAAEAGRARIADGLTEDIITRLAKLRVLFVIARGTVYALGERGIGAREAGRLLQVEYIASGSVRRYPDRLSVVVEVVDTEDARIVWTDEIQGALDDTFSVLDSIVDRIVTAIADGIESAECQRALLRPPSSLDAWQAYHRGLWHMYRFNAVDNQQAAQLFQSALALDPTFSRAHAGLSFTHFQSAFLKLTPDHERHVQLALDAAGESISADDRDPAAHWALGRALWLDRQHDESLTELQRSVELSPNFALGHYTLGFVQSQAGDARSSLEATDHSRQLSPFDPLQFAMLASRALALVRLGELDEAARWAVRAAGRPNAHTHILAIAAECLALVERRDEARQFVARIRERVPGYDVEDFLRSFRFDRDAETLFRHGARQIGASFASSERAR
jgi:DNA-binding SARP family transcriptional activator/TolB-like protein